ncbi:HPr family phosphocarrier protein [Marinisporobacter balticus]|uniref:Catabolite repression HPr-like protein/phosphocarrier protein n=1 Tax=Marinisporobacter balticus TaxID=2018667 RepID=A0A4R2KEL1_9FIRM|nr:HPr family phosphocarrier protein [Marinisporobacter balticus]TCO68776.1 catabolite repression HPr-like protein/phosphocarrier protein [Marinisporobacter balticus]
MLKKEIIVMNEQGLRARAAALFVQLSNKFTSDIFIEKDTKKVDAKSIMCIMALGLSKGEKILIRMVGPDEEEAMEALVDFLEETEINS